MSRSKAQWAATAAITLVLVGCGGGTTTGGTGGTGGGAPAPTGGV